MMLLIFCRQRWLRRALVGAGALLLAAAGFAEEPPAVELPELQFIEPWPELLAKAEAIQMPTSDWAEASAADGVPAESSVTMLVTARNKSVTRQWLVQLVARELNEKQKDLPRVESTMFTSLGHEISYAGGPVAIAIRVVGPVSAGPDGKPHTRRLKDIWSGALVNADYLRLGFDRASDVLHRLHQASLAKNAGVQFGWGDTAFAPDVVEAAQASLGSLEFSAEDARSVVGTSLALHQFFGIAAGTPGVRDLLRELMQINVWSVLARGGKLPAIDIGLVPGHGRLDLSMWNLAGTEAYSFPFVLSLEGKPVLICSMAAVPPRPPLAVSAGIFALAVKRMDDASTRMMIRAIATRAATAKTAGTEVTVIMPVEQ